MSCAAPIRAPAGEPRLEPGLAAAIDAVAGDERHLFLRQVWYAAAGGREPATLVARRADGRVVAALPSVAAGPRPLGLRAVPGCYWPFRGVAIAAEATDEELDALLGAQARLGRALRLGPVLADDPSLARLREAARRCGLIVLTRPAGTSWALDLAAEPWPKPSTLRNMHKHEKKLARIGAVDFRFVAGAEWSGEVLDRLAAIERNSWVGHKADADPKFVDPALRRGWEAMIAEPEMAAMLSAGIVSVGGEPVAFSFGLNCGRTRYCIATSYDARFARQSVGYLTGYWTYMAAAERGVTRLSLGAGDTGEKRAMGAVPEAELVDCLFVRGAGAAALLRPFWRSRR